MLTLPTLNALTTDLWDLNECRTSSRIGDIVELEFYQRVRPSRRPAFLRARQNHASEASNRTVPALENTTVDEIVQPLPASPSSDSSHTSHSLDAKRDGDNKFAPSSSHQNDEAAREFAQRAQEEEELYTFWQSKVGWSFKPWLRKRDAPPKYDESLVKVLHRQGATRFWLNGLGHLVSMTLDVTSPLVTQGLLRYLTASYAHARDPLNAPDPGPASVGWGYAIGLWAMMLVSAFARNLGIWLGQSQGVEIRSAVISLIYRKSLRLSAKARLEYTPGKLTTLISSDAFRLEQFVMFVHLAWVIPIVLVLAVALLIKTLGVAALVSVAVLIIGIPVQAWLLRGFIMARRAQMKNTDVRANMVQEILAGIKLVLLYNWRDVMAERVGSVRRRELVALRRFALYTAFTFLSVHFVPTIATALGFVTYALLKGGNLDPATIFAAFQLLNALRIPLLLLPLAAGAAGDAYVALKRISALLVAEEIEGVDTFLATSPLSGGSAGNNGVHIKGDFQWELAAGEASGAAPAAAPLANKDQGAAPAAKKSKAELKAEAKAKKAKEQQEKTRQLRLRKQAEQGLPVDERDGLPPSAADTEERPFGLHGLDINIPSGAFVAIVGPVGSGKSSLLQAMLGDMRKSSSDAIVQHRGSTAYAAQAPWILNRSLRENVFVGSEDNNALFDVVVDACALAPDLELLPGGEKCQIGEKGVNLSGGQKARVSLARAMAKCVSQPGSILLADDPFAAVDAHVGDHILHKCFLGPHLRNVTRIVATHQLHVLPHADSIIVLSKDGRVAEQGSYEQLMQGGALSELVKEYGNTQETSSHKEEDEAEEESTVKPKSANSAVQDMMQDEERAIGAVGWQVYRDFILTSGSFSYFALLAVVLILMQATSVGTTLILGFWTSDTIPHFGMKEYIGLYLGLGMSTGVFTFLSSFGTAIACFFASLRLFRNAFDGALQSPLRWFERTPSGRIQSRLTKDVDVVDLRISDRLFSFASAGLGIFGTFALVTYAFPWLGLMFPPLFVLFWATQSFYRRSSREAKRVEALLRSHAYAIFGETFGHGVQTIRAFRQESTFIAQTNRRLDDTSRAGLVSNALSAWLATRLDILATLIVLGLGIFAMAEKNKTAPGVTGAALTYSVAIVTSLSQLVELLAELERNFISVQRLQHYATLEKEGEFIGKADPEPSWPSSGRLDFDNVQMRYADELPMVLKGVSFSVAGGERVGVVGRTGAGKSSLFAALMRTTEISSGKIAVDGVDTSSVGLNRLRDGISVVPQDAFLFTGTLRENLDPGNQVADVDLHAALRTVGLTAEGEDAGRFKLESNCRDDTFSAGERQLIALARALARPGKVLILDEATAQLDIATDTKVQKAIRKARGTLLIIAHRLNTIAFCDKIIVMDGGKVIEQGNPLELFDLENGAFRSMCMSASLTRAQIEKSQGQESE